MRDIDKFRTKLQELLKARGSNQKALVAKLPYSETTFSKKLNDNGTLSPAEVTEIVKAMVKIGAVIYYDEAQELLAAMECDLSEDEWSSEPLNRLKGSRNNDLQKRYAELEEENKQLKNQLQINTDAARQAAKFENARTEMARATTKASQLAAYKQALQLDQNLALIHVLDMSKPLTLDSMYIKLRLHEHRKAYRLAEQLEIAQAKSDPNEHIWATRSFLTAKTTTAYEPAEALRSYKHMVVLGDPGAGKTTLLKYLALRSVQGELLPDLPDFPVHVILGRLATDLRDHSRASGKLKDFSLVNWVADYWEERYNFPKADALTLLEEQLTAGNALVLLDGLDETVNGGNDEEARESYDRITTLIQNFTNHYPAVRVVVTVRFAGFSGNLPGFTEFEVLDFTPDDIEEFVANWYSHDPAIAADLQAQLKQNPRVETLAANPLLLTLIALVFESDQGLPNTRNELYEKCVETLLEKWDKTRRIKRVGKFTVKQKEWLLREIGWHFHSKRQRYLPKKELLAAIGEFLPIMGLDESDNQEILQEIAAEHGLLKEQARGWYGFLHLTLQEYFAAQHAARHVGPECVQFLLEHHADKWWQEVILLYVGEADDVSLLIGSLWELVENEQDDIFNTALLLVADCLATQPRLRNRTIKPKVVEQLFSIIQDETDYDLNREAVAERLISLSRGGQVTERNILSRTLELLTDENLDAFVRRDIAYAIGKLGGKSILPQLLHLLVDENLDIFVRRGITVAIGDLGDKSVLPRLLELLAYENLDILVRRGITVAIGDLGDKSVLPRLLQLLVDENLGGFVRRDIAIAIGELGDKSVLPRLLELLVDESLNDWMRVNIISAIGELGDVSVLPRLLELLADESLNDWVRGDIVSVIGKLGDVSVLPRLLELLADEYINSFVCRNTVTVLGKLGDVSALPQLLELLVNETLDKDIQGCTAESIFRLGDVSVLPQLLELLVNETLDSLVRMNIAETIKELGDISILPSLLELVADETLDNSVRYSIASLIEELGDISILPSLLELVADENLNRDLGERLADSIVNLGQTLEDLQVAASLLQKWDVFNQLHKASRRVGARLYWQDKEKRLVRVEQINY